MCERVLSVPCPPNLFILEPAEKIGTRREPEAPGSAWHVKQDGCWHHNMSSALASQLWLPQGMSLTHYPRRWRSAPNSREKDTSRSRNRSSKTWGCLKRRSSGASQELYPRNPDTTTNQGRHAWMHSEPSDWFYRTCAKVCAYLDALPRRSVPLGMCECDIVSRWLDHHIKLLQGSLEASNVLGWW